VRREWKPDGNAVLVTGAAGLIGNQVLRVLASQGYRVTGLDIVNGYGSAAPDSLNTVRRLQQDFADARVLNSVARGDYRAIVHHAAIVDTTLQDSNLMMRENSERVLELAQAAHHSGAYFIYASSFSVYGRIAFGCQVREDSSTQDGECSGPLNAYAQSKLALDEAMLRAYRSTNWFWAALRYTNAFGRGEATKGRMASMMYQVLRNAAQGETIRLFKGTLNASRDYVPVQMIANCITRMLGRPGAPGIYNVGSGVPISFATLLQWCSDYMSPDTVCVEFVDNPFPDAYQYWTCADMSKWRDEFGPVWQLTKDGIYREAKTLFDDLRQSAAHALALSSANPDDE